MLNLAALRPARKVSGMHSPIPAPFRMWTRRASAAALCAVLFLACHRGPHSTGSTGSAQAVVDPDPLAPLPAALHGARLPERLDDSTFWRLVNDLSEPGGFFQSENFVSNEMALQWVIGQLEMTAPPGGVYVGVGPEQNFTYIGALRPRIAFIVDIRRQNLLQHLWYKAVFELSPTRATFLARLFARPGLATVPTTVGIDSLITLLNGVEPDSLYFRRTFEDVRHLLVQRHDFTLDSIDLATLHYIDGVFAASGPSLNYSSGAGRDRGPFNRMPTFAQIATTTDERGVNRGFLGSEANYRVVRDMQRRNLIVPVVGNFSGPKALRAVGDWLRERDATVNVFYTSNVEQYLFQQFDGWSRFYANVGSMPLDSASRFIRSATSGGRFGFSGSGGAGGGGLLMQQLTSPITEIVKGAESGAIREYRDVLGASRP